MMPPSFHGIRVETGRRYAAFQPGIMRDKQQYMQREGLAHRQDHSTLLRIITT